MITASSLFVFILGLIIGYVLNMIIDKWVRKIDSPSSIKREFEAYRNEVESHFEATSEKFQSMSNQYQDLYQHLAKGATSLCRADKIHTPMVEHAEFSAAKPQLEAAQKQKTTSDTKETLTTKTDKNTPEAKVNLGAKPSENEKKSPSAQAPKHEK